MIVDIDEAAEAAGLRLVEGSEDGRSGVA